MDDGKLIADIPAFFNKSKQVYEGLTHEQLDIYIKTLEKALRNLVQTEPTLSTMSTVSTEEDMEDEESSSEDQRVSLEDDALNKELC